MQNRLHSLSYQFDNFSQRQQPQDIEDHFNALLGQSNSRYTAAQTVVQANNEQSFHSNRMFAISTLQSWGLKIGTLAFSKDNEITLKCILDLISQKQKDIDYKMKIKQQINSINFQKEKYQSLLKQSKHSIAEKQKFMGKLENQSTELKKKIKLLETQFKKEKADDQKMIMMLKSKNQQILHQIKKKQAQAIRIKQQMKKTVNAKTAPQTANKHESPIHSNNITPKNCFEMIEKLQRIGVKGQKWKKNSTQRTTKNYSDNLQEQKFNFMIDKYEKEKKIFLNQNSLLRDKVYEIRDELVKFAEWIEVELFGQSIESTRKFLEKRFICNHNFMFSQNALIDDLLEIISQAKNGIVQLQQRVQHSQAGSMPSCKSIESPLKSKKVGFTNQSTKSIGSQSNPMFKKKSTSIREVEYPTGRNAINTKSQKSIKESQKQIKQRQKQKIQEPKQRISRVPVQRSPQVMQPTYQTQENGMSWYASEIRGSSQEHYFNELQLSAFQNDILSDIHEHSEMEDPDHSIVSHISTSELLREIQRGKSKYDKWDILFKSEGDQEQEEEE